MIGFARRWQIAILILALGFVALTGVSMTRAAFNTNDPIPGQVRFVGIDAQPSGNSFTDVAFYQNVAFLHNGDTFTVDVVVDEIDASDGLMGLEGALVYDESIVHVVSIDAGSMAYANPDNQVNWFTATDDLPDNDGQFKFVMQDLNQNEVAETGEGVLARITLHCDSMETAILRLEEGYGLPEISIWSEASRDEPGGPFTLPIQTQDSATIFCGSTPTPTPQPSNGTVTPPPTGGTVTPTPTPTPPVTPTPTPTPTPLPGSPTPCPTVSPTNCDVVPSNTPGTITPTPTSDPTPTPTPTPCPTNCITPTPTPTGGPTSTPSPTPSGTPVGTASPTPICSPLPGDPDCDQHINPNDNCPTVWNYDQADGDSDGVGNVCDNCPSWANGSQALPDWTVPVGDGDCDGFPDSVSMPPPNAMSSEAFMGTNATSHCASTTGTNPAFRNDEPPPDRWPVDFDDNGTVNGSDLLTFAPVFGGISPNVPYDARWDLNTDGGISGSDLLKLAPFFGKTCA